MMIIIGHSFFQVKHRTVDQKDFDDLDESNRSVDESIESGDGSGQENESVENYSELHEEQQDEDHIRFDEPGESSGRRSPETEKILNDLQDDLSGPDEECGLEDESVSEDDDLIYEGEVKVDLIADGEIPAEGV